MTSGAPPSSDAQRFADVPDPVGALGPRRELAPPDETAPTRTVRARRVAFAVAVGLGSSALLSVLLTMRRDWREHLPSLGALAVSSLLTTLLLSPGRRVAPARGPLFAAIVCVPAVFAALVVALAKERHFGDYYWADLCFVFGVLTALLPLLAGIFALQRSFAASSTLRGAALGLACGALGSFSIHLHCDVLDLAHVLSGHGLPMIAATAIGAVLGRRFGRA